MNGDVRTQAKLSGIDTPVSIEAVTVDGSISLKDPIRIYGSSMLMERLMLMEG